MSTSSSTLMPALPSADLRGEAKAYKRDKSHTAKWALGGRPAPGKFCNHDLSVPFGSTCSECVARPSKRYFGNCSVHRAERAVIHANTHAHRQDNIAKKVLQNDLQEVTMNSDTSGDEEVAHTNEAPVPESEIMYSYDAKSGPSNGADVLSNAVMQAVKRYENKQTEQLIKNEYDTMPDHKEFEDVDAYAGDVEGDFELVDYSEMH